MLKEIQNKYNVWSQDSFPQSSFLMTMLPFSLLEGDDSFSITHPFSRFRFCVINHVSAPKLLTLISVKCPMDTRMAHKMSFVIICGILWHPVLYTTVGPGHFCALPSECLALLQCQQLNMFVCWTSSVVDMLSAQSTCQHLPPTVESHYPYLPVFVALHILHTPSPTGSGFSLVQHTSHTKIKMHFILQNLPWFQQTIHLYSDILMVPTHSCTVTPSTHADYMLKSGVPWYYFMSDMLLTYFLKLPCVPVRGRKLKIWFKEHIHSREYNWDE